MDVRSRRLYCALVRDDRQYLDSGYVVAMSDQERRGVYALVFMIFVMAILLAVSIGLLLFATKSHAMEGDGHSMSPHKEWFASLKNRLGDACCSDADGTALLDADWEADANGKYRVRIDGEWHVVPDEAVLKGPNMDGRTIVWPLNGALGFRIRCFIPGVMG